SATWGDPGSDTIQWIYLHQGGRYFRFDASAGTYHFRNRDLSATLGRWMQQDPIGFAGKDQNLYRHIGNSPQTLLDPQGLADFNLTVMGSGFTGKGTHTVGTLGELWNVLDKEGKKGTGDCIKQLELGGHALPSELLLHGDGGTTQS